MSAIYVSVATPSDGSRIGARDSVYVAGSISVQVDNPGFTVQIGKTVMVAMGVTWYTATFDSATDWHVYCVPPSDVAPTGVFSITVQATATLQDWTPGDEFIGPQAGPPYDIGTQAAIWVGMPLPVKPTASVTPIAPIVGDHMPDQPKSATLFGGAQGADGYISKVEFSAHSPGPNGTVVSGPYGAAWINWTSGLSAGWSVTLPLPPGPHSITARATDRFGTVGFDSPPLNFTVNPQPPVPTGGNRTLVDAPTTSSVTSWTRLEPQCSNADIGLSSRARVFDPLWMLTRQWQMGEFQAEDAGTPVQARLRATSAPITRCYFGELPQASGASPPAVSATAYDATRTPLEVMVERRRTRARDSNETRLLTFAVDAGLHFLRMLDAQKPSKSYRTVFVTKLALQAPPAPIEPFDDATVRYLQSMVGRAPDGRVLANLLRTTGAAALVADTTLKIATADKPKVQQAATAWLAWYDSIYAEPASASDDAWSSSRLEYAMSIAGRLSANAADDLTYSANEIDGSTLDWSNFDVSATHLDTSADTATKSLVTVIIPAPLSFKGAPAPRFWEMEDAAVAYGVVPVGPTDIGHLMLIEYASTYGNDWFVVPLTLDVGSVTRVDSLVVTDTFGKRNLVRPIGDSALPAPYFSLWQSAYGNAPGNATNRFLLPPTLTRTLDSAPLEEVMFLRDEMANVGWAVERSVESPIERPAQRYDASFAPATAGATAPLPRYLLSSTVPTNWIPFLPVTVPPPAGSQELAQLRLKRGAVLQPDGSKIVHGAVGDILKIAVDSLLYDEEIPRAGVQITRRRRLTRWTDGSTWLWTSMRNQTGRGEGSSGLQFDQVLEPGGQ